MKPRICTVLLAIAYATLLTGCGSSNNNAAVVPPPPPPPVEQSIAGNWGGTAVTPDIPDVVTGFEFDDADGFDVGASPFSATFTGGVTETRGVPGFYADGINSWHIPGDDPAVIDATIEFETPALTLAFSTRTVTDNDVAIIEVKDTAGAVIDTIIPPDAAITAFTVDSTGGLPIGSVEISVETGEIVIDGLTYAFPSTAATDDVGCIFANDEFACVITDPATDAIVAAANGIVTVAVDQVTGTGWLYAAPGEVFADGSTVAALTISAGTVAEGATLDLTVDSAGVAIAVTTAFDDTFDRASDLATVEASYMDFDILGDASTFDVDATGVISGTSTAGCLLAGQISLIDAAMNAYDVAITVTDGGTCGIPAGDYNGLGTIDDSDPAAPDTNDELTFGAFLDGMAYMLDNPVKSVP